MPAFASTIEQSYEVPVEIDGEDIAGARSTAGGRL